MIKFIRKLLDRFTCKEVVHFTVGLELSDGDRATIYGWPNKTIEEVSKHG